MQAAPSTLEGRIESIGYPDGTKIQVRRNFDFLRGECIGINGANGAGKSTFLKVLSGVIPYLAAGAVDGSLRFDGKLVDKKNVVGMWSRLRYISEDVLESMIFATAKDEIDCATWLGRTTVLPSAVQSYVHALRAQIPLRNIRDLSSGELQKLAIACALLNGTRVLILDEPTQALDEKSRLDLYCAVEGLRGLTTIVTATHDAALLSACSQVMEFASAAPERSAAWGRFHIDVNIALGERIDCPSLISRSVVVRYNGFAGHFPDLDIGPGDAVWLRGANGAGKSTLLRCLAGLQRPTSGKIVWSGACGEQMSPSTSFLQARVRHSFVLPTIGQELAYSYGRVARQPLALAVEAFLDNFLGAGCSSRDPRSLSHAQQRITSLALRIPDNSMLFLDEPSIGLDEFNQQQVIALCQSIIRKGLAVVFASHDEHFAAKLATREIHL